MTPERPVIDRPLVSDRYLAHVLGVPREALLEVAERVESFYQPFVLTQYKRGREKKRPIDNPIIPLKSYQSRIKTRLLDTLTFPPFIYGGVRKRSTQENARCHVRHREVAPGRSHRGSIPRRGPMNLSRIAELLRQVADELDGDSDEARAPAEVARRPRQRSFPAPLKPVSDTDKTRARKFIRRRGMGA